MNATAPASTAPVVTRTDNGNGTFAYAIDTMPEFAIQASKVLYTHASAYGDFTDPNGHIVNFHKTEAVAVKAAMKNNGVRIAL